MDKKQPFRIALALLVMLSVASSINANPTPAPDTATGVEGVVTISPTRPGPIRQGVPDSAPLAHREFVVKNEKGTVTTFTTDDQGKFRISLPAGHYTVSLTGKRVGMGMSGRFDVDVASGRMTTVHWDFDTGMR